QAVAAPRGQLDRRAQPPARETASSAASSRGRILVSYPHDPNGSAMMRSSQRVRDSPTASQAAPEWRTASTAATAGTTAPSVRAIGAAWAPMSAAGALTDEAALVADAFAAVPATPRAALVRPPPRGSAWVRPGGLAACCRRLPSGPG